MKVNRCPIPELTDEQLKKFYSLNMRGRGSMRDHLLRCRTDKLAEGVAFWIEDEDGRVLSWATVAHWQAWGGGEYDVMFYTRRTHRRRGLAEAIAKKIKKRYRNAQLYSHGWDERSLDFFGKVGI